MGGVGVGVGIVIFNLQKIRDTMSDFFNLIAAALSNQPQLHFHYLPLHPKQLS
jgi:hypothetical protein